MEVKSISFANNRLFGESAMVKVYRKEGMFNNVEKALTLYHQTFGVTEGLQMLQSVWFKNGYYEFVFSHTDAIYKGWQHLVRFVLAIDWDSPFGMVQVGSEKYEVRDFNFEKSNNNMNI